MKRNWGEIRKILVIYGSSIIFYIVDGAQGDRQITKGVRFQGRQITQQCFKPLLLRRSSLIAFFCLGIASNAAIKPTAAVNSTLLPRCDKKTVHLTQTTGTIRSPNYPQGYEINSQCTWHIQVPRGFRIKVRFRRQFDLEDSPGCTKDYVMLATSKQFRNPLIYCGGARPHGIITPQNAVWIRFRSDNGTTGKGFYISYMSVGKLLVLNQIVCDWSNWILKLSTLRFYPGRNKCMFYETLNKKSAVTLPYSGQSVLQNLQFLHVKITFLKDKTFPLRNRKHFIGTRLTSRFFFHTDENECKRPVCTFPSLCRNTYGSYACDCPEGYANRGPKDSARCQGWSTFYMQ